MRARVLAAALVLTGCASLLDERIWDSPRLNTVTLSDFSSFAASGAVVEILGTPHDGSDAASVAAMLRLPGRFPQAPFRLATRDQSRPAAQAGVRLVIAFGLAGGADGWALCRGEATVPPTPPQAGLEVTGALCNGSRPDAAARLSHRRPLGIDDPAFTTAMTRLLDTLAPRDAERRERSDNCLTFRHLCL